MSASRPNVMAIEITSPEQFLMIMDLLNSDKSDQEKVAALQLISLIQSMQAEMKASAANEASVSARKAPSSPMMFRSPSPSSPVVKHDCGADKVVEAPKPRGCH